MAETVNLFLPPGMMDLILFWPWHLTRSLMVEYLVVPLVHLQTRLLPALLQLMFLIPWNLSFAVLMTTVPEAGALAPVLVIPITVTL